MLKLTVKNINFDNLKKKLQFIRQTSFLIDCGNNIYFTQIFTQDIKEYKKTLERINDKFRENLVELKPYNIKDFQFINKYPLKKLLKK